MPGQMFEVYQVYPGMRELVMTYEVPRKQSGCKVGHIEPVSAAPLWFRIFNLPEPDFLATLCGLTLFLTM